MKTSSKKLFFFMTLMSTIMVMCSNSWISMWMGMEINLMSFIPLLFSNKNKFLSQSTMMYFLIQSLASIMFITIILNNKYNFFFMNNEMNKLMIFMTMMMKMGMPPFHLWLPEIMEKINWLMCLMLMTWQKIAPMCIISALINLENNMKFMIYLSVMMGALGGLNQTSVKKMMSYSSMSHLGWITICALTYKKSWMMYMLVYSMLMAMFSFIMFKYNIMFFTQMNIFLKKNMEKNMMLSLMLSISGLPPFIGFLPKWITLQYMIVTSEFIMMLIMIMSSLVMILYYLRMMSSMSLIFSHSQKWMMLSTSMKNTMNIIFLSNLSLPMVVMLLNFY